MKLNLKFEIEVLCKTLSLEVMDLKPSSILKDEEAYKVVVRQLPYPGITRQAEDPAKALPTRVQPPPLSEPTQVT
jgi:CCR4-NOT transcription complex subunit 1